MGAAAPPVESGRPQTPQRTLMGVAAPFEAHGAAHGIARGLQPHALAGTSVIQEDGLTRTQPLGTSAHAHAARAGLGHGRPRGRGEGDDTQPGYDPLTDPHSATATIVDAPVFDLEHELSRTQPMKPSPAANPMPHAAPAGSPAARAGATLMGVARPGIAPLNPGVRKPAAEEEPPPSYRPLEELGATQNVPKVRKALLQNPAKPELHNTHPLGKRRFDKRIDLRRPQQIPKDRGKRGSSRKPLFVLAAALFLVIGGILAVVLWPSPPPLSAQVRAAEGGAEVLDVTCQSCPDGTKLAVKDRDAEAVVNGGKATLPLDSPLNVGDNSLRVVIDRPASGRDETVTLPVRVAYRIRPDLTTLEADRPSLQIVIEAMDGASVQLDGEDVPLRDGRAVKTVDISKTITGSSADAAAQLNRKISFVVKPPDQPEEKGVVAVSLPVVPLSIAAPGRAIVTDKQTFILSGQTSPGAELFVAGRSLGVMKDGVFSQTMNVSSVGATQIEVRAKMAGRAPRIVHVAVERVTSLDAAAASFKDKSPLEYAAVAKAIDASLGKPISVTGEILESRVADGVTTMIVKVAGPGCDTTRCIVRLIQGRADLEVDRGRKIRAYGVVAGSVSHDGATVPDLDVSFSIVEPSDAAVDPKKPPAPPAPPPPPR